MVEQERLELTSAVTSHHDELDDLADSLENVDNALRDAGSNNQDEVFIDVEIDEDGITSAIAQLETLEDKLSAVDSELGQINAQSDPFPDSEPTTSTAVGDGGDSRELFDIESLDEVEARIGGELDFERFGARGGETSDPEDLLARDLDELVDFERVVELARDPDTDIDQTDVSAIAGMEGRGDFLDAIDRLNEVDSSATALGGRSLVERLDGAEEEFKDIRFTMGHFHDLIASLIPLLGIFVGAMPAAITGLVALGGAAIVAAGALAGIGALGAMGMSLQEEGELSFDPINEELVDIREEFVDTFAPLAGSFAPFVRDALTEVERMLGPLATAASSLRLFTDEFATMTTIAGDAIPALVDQSLRFGHAVMPLLARLGSFILNKDIFGFMANQLAVATPELVRLGKGFAQLLPAIIRISQGFLTVASALVRVVGAAFMLFNIFPGLGAAIGIAVSAYLALITASTLYTIITAQAVKAIFRFAAALLVKVVPALISAASKMFAFAASSWTATFAVGALLGVLTGGLALLGLWVTQTDALATNLNDATSSLRDFASLSGGLANTSLGATGGGTGGGRAGVYRDNSTTVINAGDRDSATRQQYSNQYERAQHVDSVFGG